MSRQTSSRKLRLLLDRGSGLNQTPADLDIDPKLSEALAELDLLEAYLTGLISEGGLEDPDSFVLVERQFDDLEARLNTNSNIAEMSQLFEYVKLLKKEYGDLRRWR